LRLISLLSIYIKGQFKNALPSVFSLFCIGCTNHAQHAVCPPLSALVVGNLELSPGLRFNVESLLLDRDIFKVSVMTGFTHLCFLSLRSQQNNRDVSFHILLWSLHLPSYSVMDRASQYALNSPPSLPQSFQSHPVFGFLSMLSAVNILHQAQAIMTFISASSFTGVVCAIFM